MPDRGHIPNSPACGQWETLLAEALDGLLSPGDEATFSGHMRTCAACTELFDEAKRGREWLEFLSPAPEVPEGLLDKILAATGPGQAAIFGQLKPAGAAHALPVIQPWQRPGFMAQMRRFAEPRLMMTAAMAFFSVALTMNLLGVRLVGMKAPDLRPNAVRSMVERRLTMASTPIIRYYDHLRLVYEVQSRMREMRQDQENAQPQQPAAPGESRQGGPRKDGGSRVSPPQESGTPAGRDTDDFLEAAFRRDHRPAQSLSLRHAPQKESSIWTA